MRKKEELKTQLTLLENLITQGEVVNTAKSYSQWVSSVLLTLSQIYGKDSKEFETFNFGDGSASYGTDMQINNDIINTKIPNDINYLRTLVKLLPSRKEESRRIIPQLSNDVFYTLIFVIIGGYFTLGIMYHNASLKVIELQGKLDSFSTTDKDASHKSSNGTAEATYKHDKYKVHSSNLKKSDTTR